MPERPTLDYQPEIPIDFDELIESHYDASVEEATANVPVDLSKREAKRWVWNASDELAIRNGCRFDLRRGMHFAYSLRNHLTLWEGRWAGEPFILRTWQPECMLRVFGWVRPHPQLGWVRRFSKAAIWTPKKMGKSPSGAAVSIYVWKFDGIWKSEIGPNPGGGSHVYCIAKNGKQAGIVWNHARNMIQHSPSLKLECERGLVRVNAVRSLVRDERRLSHLTTVTGDSPAARAAAEGLNCAGIVCDEAHVVDSRTVEIVRDAGASQEQFLWFQVSTFGSSDGYGKSDLEIGRDVERGRIEDDGYFFKAYAAPPDSTDADCADPKIWKLANPNLGYTVSERQFKESFERAKDDPAEFAGFKQRRLNIWQRAANPMIDALKWAECGEAIAWGDLAGVGGGTGLDLAASEDWAAIAHCWDDGDLLKVWVKMWTSQEWIDSHRHLGDFQAWANEGLLVAHEGSAIDLTEVEEDVRELLRHTKSRCLGYDKMFGMQMAQSLKTKLPRVGIYKFGQSVENYAAGTAELKAAIRNGMLRHPQNTALDWQVSHVQSIRRGEYEKPIKDADAPWKKIDAVQAMIMAIDVKRYATDSPRPWVAIV